VAGEGLVNAIAAALGDAGIEPGELGHVNAGATGSPEEDSIEARAIERALGDSATSVPVTALAGYLGHSDAGSGAVELAGCLLAAGHRLVPFTRGFRSLADGCRLDIVSDTARVVTSSLGLSCNRTEFGQSAAVVVRAESPILS
jgi:3-oxoacyl-[acyl-carrier-protein] synthase II